MNRSAWSGTTPAARPVGASFFPLDRELALRPFERFTPRVAEVVTRLGATVPFAEAAALLELVLGVRVSEATERRQTYAAGEAALAVETAELERVERELPVAASPPERLQISLDATKVPLVGGDWSEIKLGVFSDLVPGHARDGQPVLQAVQHSYAARWEPAERFGRTLTLEASRRGVDEAGLIVSPNDGAEWIQGILDQIAPQAVRILDEMHAAEHLGVIAGLVFGAGTAVAQAWTERQRTRLRTEAPDGVLTELTRCLMRGPRPGTPVGDDGLAPAQLLAREVAYFHKRADQIRYAAFRQQEYPIGSGTVESGHRVVIGARFKGAGQHWQPAHLNPLLVLRTTICNERWAQTWPAIGSQRRQTTQATCAQRQRRHHFAQLVACLQPMTPPSPGTQSPPASDVPATPPPTPDAPTSRSASPETAPAPGPHSPKPSPWRRSNSLFFVKRRSA